MKAFFLILCVGLSGASALAQVHVIDKPAPPKTFQSPLNGERRLDDPEGRDYTKLQQLYDNWKDDLRAEDAAKAHGSHAEFERARALVSQSDAAFHAALDQYVEDWSGFNFPKGYRPVAKDDPTDQMGRRFKEDRAKVMKFLLTHERSVVIPHPNGVKAQPKKTDDCKNTGGLGGSLEQLACQEGK